MDFILKACKIEKEARKKLPEALSRQKKKFLIAINSISEENNWSKEDEEFVENVIRELNSFILLPRSRPISFVWEDSKAINKVESKIEEHAVFQLPRYLSRAKIVLLAFSGANVTNYATAMEYILIHARRFGDPSKRIFAVTEIATNIESTETTNNGQIKLPNTKFMNKIDQLIKDLGNSYDETKFRILNVNVTYITLLMLRRIVRNETEFLAAMKRIQTHDNYVKLCPWPLDNLLPKSDTSRLSQVTPKDCALLAVHAYLNVSDGKTKRVLQVTCMQYMKWCGLQLPHLFFKVVELYNIEAGKLWDLLSLNITAESLIKLANNYYAKNEMLRNQSKTQDWFPYCRALNGNFHRDLSAKENGDICFILAYLVDFKIGFDKSTIRLSHWAKSIAEIPRHESLKKIAKEIYEKYSS